MMKILGAVLILTASAWFGVGKARQYYGTVAQLRQLSGGLEILRCEINYSLTPLPELCRVTAGRLRGPVGDCFLRLSRELELSGPGGAAAALEETRGLLLPPEAKMAFLELWEGLGRYDLEGSNRLLTLCAQRIRGALEAAEEEKRPMARMYGVLALCTGLSIVILAV